MKVQSYTCPICGSVFEHGFQCNDGIAVCSRRCLCLKYRDLYTSFLPKMKGKTYVEVFGEAKAKAKSIKCANSLRKHPRKHEMAVARGLARARAQGGKSNIEYFGEDRARDIIAKGLSTTAKGRTPAYFIKRSELTKKQMLSRRGKTFEQIYGVDYAKLIKNKQSLGIVKACIDGRLTGAGRAYKRGYFRDVKYDSSYELKFLELAKEFAVQARRCKYWIKYVDSKGFTRRYNPDFELLLEGRVICIVEVKDTVRLQSVDRNFILDKLPALLEFARGVGVAVGLYTNELFNKYANPEPSSLNSFLQDMKNLVNEKVQRPGVEDTNTNKTPVEGIVCLG